jgi:hypothetical protein
MASEPESYTDMQATANLTVFPVWAKQCQVSFSSSPSSSLARHLAV